MSSSAWQNLSTPLWVASTAAASAPCPHVPSTPPLRFAASIDLAPQSRCAPSTTVASPTLLLIARRASACKRRCGDCTQVLGACAAKKNFPFPVSRTCVARRAAAATNIRPADGSVVMCQPPVCYHRHAPLPSSCSLYMATPSAPAPSTVQPPHQSQNELESGVRTDAHRPACAQPTTTATTGHHVRTFPCEA